MQKHYCRLHKVLLHQQFYTKWNEVGTPDSPFLPCSRPTKMVCFHEMQHYDIFRLFANEPQLLQGKQPRHSVHIRKRMTHQWK